VRGYARPEASVVIIVLFATLSQSAIGQTGSKKQPDVTVHQSPFLSLEPMPIRSTLGLEMVGCSPFYVAVEPVLDRCAVFEGEEVWHHWTFRNDDRRPRRIAAWRIRDAGSS
jgi:hypothetical protein